MLSAREIVELFTPDEPWAGFAKIRTLNHPALSRADSRTLFQAATELAQDPRYEKRTVRIAIAGCYSNENLRDALAIECLDRDIFCRQYHSPFAQMAQEIRDPESSLYSFHPDVIVRAPQLSFYARADESFSPPVAEHVTDAVQQDVKLLRERFAGPIVVLNFLPPEARPLGILEGKSNYGTANFYRSTNVGVSQKLAQEAGVFVCDVAHLATHNAVPSTSLHKPSYLAGCGLPDQLARAVARDVAATAAALKGFIKKCLVVDLDNTLWGGVVGEEGLGGILIGGSFPGNVYAALQKQILSLYERGVILAINSKNNENDAWEVFESRPEMLLKREHFSAARINWQDKATNLRTLVSELNIGMDSLVVLDDNPVERDWMQSACLEIYAIPASDPLEMLRFLSTTRLFDTLTITGEDRLRAKSYAAAAARKRLEGTASNLTDFLRSLEIVVEVEKPTEATLGRVSQLTQKTNQFNLTTRRYSEEQTRRMLTDEKYELFYCACKDRFADEGVIGVAIATKQQREWVLDTFLMSCRVLGRGVERAFLSAVCAHASAAGAESIIGEFVCSAKNAQTQDFYKKHGFELLDEQEGRSRWKLKLPASDELWPDWIRNGQPITRHVTT